MVKCPYRECTFEGTAEQVDEHVDYLKSVGDPEHEESERE